MRPVSKCGRYAPRLCLVFAVRRRVYALATGEKFSFLREYGMPQGTIKKLVSDRGFGFIDGDDRDEVFFHHSVVQGTTFEALSEGQTIEYEAERGQKGPKATTVKVV